MNVVAMTSAKINKPRKLPKWLELEDIPETRYPYALYNFRFGAYALRVEYNYRHHQFELIENGVSKPHLDVLVLFSRDFKYIRDKFLEYVDKFYFAFRCGCDPADLRG
ncbi:hypothetical protein [Capybara microvirus Cap3_SP_446]|nr:hypothetical protein [Capybara microvirus Cap3_SP_446]